jgi:elongation factor Ts
MTITASAVNELRQKTGAGLMDCKKALTEAGGDFEKAIDYLRKKGQKVSELRAGRESKEGVVYAHTSSNHANGVIVHLSCETDFVAKNAEFVGFAKEVANVALINNVTTLEQLLKERVKNATIADNLAEMVGKIGEKIDLKKFDHIAADYVVAYNHSNYKVAVLVGFNKPHGENLSVVGKDIAMQIAAMSPIAIDKDGIPQEVIDREMEIAKEQIRAEGKPENMLEKIAAGKLQKFFKESTLLNQQFVKDGNKTVADVLKETDKDLKITRFVRINLG